MAKTIYEIGNHMYEMEEEKAIEMLKFGKDKMACSIYGVYREGYAKAMNERYSNKEDLRKAVLNYTMKGFTVLFNE